jgi:hypothetical protein
VNFTWKSPKFEADAYKKLTEVNWIAEYKLMYLKQLKLVTKAARPSLSHLISNYSQDERISPYRITSGTHVISKTRLVKGAATDASASEREIPTSAAFKAPQSFAPSPQNPQQ